MKFKAIQSKSGPVFIIGYSILSSFKLESMMNIFRTCFLCIVLAISSLYFTKDAQDMVLDPLERMIEKVKIIAANPMSAASEEINNAGIYCFAHCCETQPKKKKFQLAKVHIDGDFCDSDSDVEDEKIKNLYETEALEKAIVKIGYLLALGFGEAGSGIIGQNMTSSGSLDPMMPGKKTYAIFGFCILDQFLECTEVL